MIAVNHLNIKANSRGACCPHKAQITISLASDDLRQSFDVEVFENQSVSKSLLMGLSEKDSKSWILSFKLFKRPQRRRKLRMMSIVVSE